MTDRIAEGIHCDELGQGVALLSCLLSSFFHYDYVQSLLIAIYRVYHCQIFVNFPLFWPFFFYPLFSSSSCLISFILRSLGHFSFTWSYLNVMILRPLLIPNLLSTELQYSPLIQITLNPPFAAVSRKSQAV